MTYNYEYIEESLLRLARLLEFILKDSEKQDIQDFIDAGEYGITLEALVDIVTNEKNKQISKESLRLILELAEIMKFDKMAFEDMLRGRVFDD